MKPIKILDKEYTRYSSDEAYVPVWRVIKDVSTVGYLNVIADVFMYDEARDEIRGLHYHPAGNISLVSQADTSTNGSYGWGMESAWKVSSSKISELAKTMKWLETRYDKIVRTVGTPQSFGQHLTFMARASKIQTCVVPAPSGGKCKWLNLDVLDMSRVVDGWITEWHEQHGPFGEKKA